MPQAVGAIGGLVGGAMQARSASRAADAQSRAAGQDIALQRETRDQIRGDLAGYREGGNDAYSAYLYELGLGPRPTFGGNAPQIETINIPGTPGGTTGGGFTPGGILNGIIGGSNGISMPANATSGGTPGSQQFRVGGQTFNTMEDAQAYANANRSGGQQYGGFQRSQDYLFGLREGTNAIEAGAAARGGLFSGATMRDLNIFGQDYGSQRRGEYLNRLAGVADTGMNAAQMSGNASMAAAGNMSNALAARGNAAAAGAIGVGNAWSDGIGNALGAWNYMRPAGGGGGATPFDPSRLTSGGR
jgi:hypothetical protein